MNDAGYPGHEQDDGPEPEPLEAPRCGGPFEEPEPCYGRCGTCGQSGDVWYINREWRCWQCAERKGTSA